MDIKIKIGKRIKELRLNKSFTQEDVSELTGMDRTYISGIERGLRNISIVNLEKLIVALESNWQDFFENI